MADLVGAMRKVHSDDIQTTYAKLDRCLRREEEGRNNGLTFAKFVNLVDRVRLWTCSELC